MKRTGFLLATAMAFVMCLAVPALAADGSSLPNPGGPGVSGAGGSGGTAFTGANVQTTFVFLVAFLVVGAMAVYFGRRRSIAAR